MHDISAVASAPDIQPPVGKTGGQKFKRSYQQRNLLHRMKAAETKQSIWRYGASLRFCSRYNRGRVGNHGNSVLQKMGKGGRVAGQEEMDGVRSAHGRKAAGPAPSPFDIHRRVAFGINIRHAASQKSHRPEQVVPKRLHHGAGIKIKASKRFSDLTDVLMAVRVGDRMNCDARVQREYRPAGRMGDKNRDPVPPLCHGIGHIGAYPLAAAKRSAKHMAHHANMQSHAVSPMMLIRKGVLRYDLCNFS